MKITEAFDALKAHFGTHRAAASALGVSERQYTGWRTGTYPVPESRKKHIILFAGILSSAKNGRRLKSPKKELPA